MTSVHHRFIIPYQSLVYLIYFHILLSPSLRILPLIFPFIFIDLAVYVCVCGIGFNRTCKDALSVELIFSIHHKT